jgi:DNA-binding NarL/FixJ family response regulator
MSDYPELTDRERQVLEAVWDGLSAKEVGDRLNIAGKSVEGHKTNIMKKWRCNSFLIACRLGLRLNYLKV